MDGRVLARNGAVTLDTNTITRPACETLPPTPPVVTPPIVTPPIVITPILGLPPIVIPPITIPIGGGGNDGGSEGGGDDSSNDNDDDNADDNGGSGVEGAVGSTGGGPTSFSQVTQVPVGSVDTGDGTTDEGSRDVYPLLPLRWLSR